MSARSPATSRAIAARSSVDAMMFSFPCARAGVEPITAMIATRMGISVFRFMFFFFFLILNSQFLITGLLERMRAMRTDVELHLEQELVGDRSFGVVGVTVLTANLAELARPVRQRERLAEVMLRRIVGTFRPIEPDAGEPAPAQLIVARHVEPGSILPPVGLLTLTPDDFRPSNE